MIRNLLTGAGLALALNACAVLQPEEKLPANPQAQGVELTKQQGGRFIAMVGPRRQHTAEFLGVSDTNYFTLRSWLDNKTQDTAHQLYIEDSYYGGPFKWDGVHDGDKKTLKFIPISRNQITCDEGCAYADEFAAELSEDYLRAHQGGFSAVFTSSDGKILPVNVPGELVTTQLAALDTVRDLAKKAAASTPEPVATAASAPSTAPATPSPAPVTAAAAASSAVPAMLSPEPAAKSAGPSSPIPAGTVVPPPPAASSK